MAVRVLGIGAIVAVAAATTFALFVVPADLNQGESQRIMYIHVATAWLAYLLVRGHAAASVLVASAAIRGRTPSPSPVPRWASCSPPPPSGPG